jgi:hypothetical protein
MTKEILKAGAATEEITPKDSQFLYGYPYVERMSEGAHDPLTCTAIYLDNGSKQVFFITHDILYLNKEQVAAIRCGISAKTGVPQGNIMVSVTHTHSAPTPFDVIISRNDKVVPPYDKEYMGFVVAQSIKAGINAYGNAREAEIGFVTGDATGLGTNRHDPAGPKDMEVPTMLVRDLDKKYIAAMTVVCMHPTVLHEDSRLCSADFPHYTRELLRKQLLGEGCPVAYFTGTSGDQSPRHVTHGNNFSEAQRLGEIVAASIISKAAEGVVFERSLDIAVASINLDLPHRQFPSVEWAVANRDRAKAHFEALKDNPDADKRETRTAEVDWFGSEEALLLSTLAANGQLEDVYASCLPAEIQVIKVGDRRWAAWPGEVFVEFGLALKKAFRNVSLIGYANGDLQGYVVTREAVEKRYYESGNSFFDVSAGYLMLDATQKLISKLDE